MHCYVESHARRSNTVQTLGVGKANLNLECLSASVIMNCLPFQLEGLRDTQLATEWPNCFLEKWCHNWSSASVSVAGKLDVR